MFKEDVQYTAADITEQNSFEHKEVHTDFIIHSDPHKAKHQPKQLHYQQPCKTYTKNTVP